MNISDLVKIKQVIVDNLQFSDDRLDIDNNNVIDILDLDKMRNRCQVVCTSCQFCVFLDNKKYK